MPVPIYEFVCSACGSGRKFSALVGVVAGATTPTCPVCGSDRLSRTVSRFARVRSDEARVDDLTDSLDNLDESDPKAMRRAMRELVEDAGDGELSSGEVDELVEEAVSEEGE